VFDRDSEHCKSQLKRQDQLGVRGESADGRVSGRGLSLPANGAVASTAMTDARFRIIMIASLLLSALRSGYRGVSNQ
jgi:hypothetical protein